MKKRIRGAAIAVSSFILIFTFTLLSHAAEVKEVYPGGFPFGVRFGNGTLTVSGFTPVTTEDGKTSSPAEAGGICENDILLSVNGKDAHSAKDVTDVVEASDGEPICLKIKKGNAEKEVWITPVKCTETGKYRIGLWLRDGAAGIGTVTYINPEDGSFGGLGHGICDGTTGKLTKISKASVFPVTVTHAAKGIPGTPGELRGTFQSRKCGALLKNTSHGVFGYMTDLPKNEKTLPVGDKIKEGDATVLCTVDGEGRKSYSASLTENSDGDGSTFFVKITDKALIEKTGGIVQGMSGSPIIQDGKLIGAVTHVCVNL